MNTQYFLESKELDYLTKYFRVTTNKSLERKYSIQSADLVDETKCLAFLNNLMDIFQSSSYKVTASQFSKRYSFLTIASSLYSMTVLNKGVNYSLENCYVESEYQDRTWLPKVRLTDWSVDKPAIGERFEWRDEVIKNIFANNLSKVWNTISKVTNISATILWENTAVYVYWLYEKRMKEEASKSNELYIYDDFYYLLNAPAALFGESENPLTRYYNTDVPSGEKPVRIRKTCCYYYKTSREQNYCLTCPRNR